MLLVLLSGLQFSLGDVSLCLSMSFNACLPTILGEVSQWGVGKEVQGLKQSFSHYYWLSPLNVEVFPQLWGLMGPN